MECATAIETRGLTKAYGGFRALRGVDLTVQKGEIFGFLGPNGAGKTTTIRCLLDLIHRDGGEVRVLGIDPRKDAVGVRANTGYLPGELSLDPNLTARAQLDYFSALRHDKVEGRFVDQLARRLDLDLHRPIKNMSRGNKQKVGLVQALMHRPTLVILDEPTLGLDPLMQQEVLNLIGQAQSDGATVFFSSHVLSEVEAVARRVAIIRDGLVVETAGTDALIERSSRRVRVRFKGRVDVRGLSAVPGVSLLSHAAGESVELQATGDMEALIRTLGTLPVRDVEIERPTLEEVFLAYYRAEERGIGDASRFRSQPQKV